MKDHNNYRRALLSFYLMVVYVLLQFFWWLYLIVAQTRIIYHTPDELQRRWWMIGGEGSVFLTLMLIGVFQVRKAFNKEILLVARQKTFLHSITHEFKSPIASLRLQLETLLKRNLTGEQQNAALNNALEDTDRLDQLLEKILVAARIDNGELPMHPVNTDISSKLKDSIDQISRANPGRMIEKQIEDGIIAFIDPWAFNSIVTNLLDNALIYSTSDKDVKVTLIRDKDKIRLTVEDRGVGIPPAERERIFEKFYRLNTSDGYKGTGLGLYLTHYLVTKNRGTITIAGNSPQGSIFEVLFSYKEKE